MVFFLAREAGIDLDTAPQVIADASENVDVNEQTEPCSGFQCLVPNGHSLQLYHFALDEDFSHNGDGGAGYVEYRLKQAGLIAQDFDLAELSPDAQREWYRAHRFLLPSSPQLSALRRAALSLTPACGTRSPFAKAQLHGEYLHALADSFSHRGPDNNPYSRKTFPFTSEGYIGHGFGGHNPDRTYNHFGPSFSGASWNYNELRTLGAERAIFYTLRQDFQGEITEHARATPGKQAKTGQDYVVQTDEIWSKLSGAKLGELANARVGYGDENPVKPGGKQIGILQKFNNDRDFDANKDPSKSSKIKRLTKFLHENIIDFDNTISASNRLKYLGNITDDDLRRQHYTFQDPDDGNKEKVELLLPCGEYKTKSGCGAQAASGSESGSP